MVSRRVSRSVRRLAGGLVVLALLAVVATPAQAGPQDWSTPTAPHLRVLDWLQSVLADLGFFASGLEEAPSEPDEPGEVLERNNADIDPSGAPSPESDVAAQPMPPIELLTESEP